MVPFQGVDYLPLPPFLTHISKMLGHSLPVEAPQDVPAIQKQPTCVLAIFFSGGQMCFETHGVGCPKVCFLFLGSFLVVAVEFSKIAFRSWYTWMILQ